MKLHSLEEITDMSKMKVYTQEEMLDITLGKIGSPARNEYEAKVEDYLGGLAIRQAREAHNLTQEELGERVGVQAAQISKIESGRNLTIKSRKS